MIKKRIVLLIYFVQFILNPPPPPYMLTKALTFKKTVHFIHETEFGIFNFDGREKVWRRKKKKNKQMKPKHLLPTIKRIEDCNDLRFKGGC